jgi:hypothetical protein
VSRKLARRFKLFVKTALECTDSLLVETDNTAVSQSASSELAGERLLLALLTLLLYGELPTSRRLLLLLLPGITPAELLTSSTLLKGLSMLSSVTVLCKLLLLLLLLLLPAYELLLDTLSHDWRT